MWKKTLQELFRRLRVTGEGKRPLKETMLILFLCGILLFVIMLPTDKNSSSFTKKNSTREKTVSTGSSTGETGENTQGAVTSVDTYKKNLEEELTEFLSSVAGVGEVKVLIYMKESQEYIVEKDKPVVNSKNGESSQESKDEVTVYTKNDNGDEIPFITQTKSPAIDGVIVAAQGAANEAVRLQIVRLVMALYGVEANKVEVTVLTKEGG